MASNHTQEATLPELRNFGAFLAMARSRRGLTQKQLGNLAGVAPSRISLMEAGKSLPTLPQLFTFARLLAVPLQWFINSNYRPGSELREIALELHQLGVVDLFVPDAIVPGAFRPTEEVIALAVAGLHPDPRIVEAIPAVLAWNRWSHTILRAYSRQAGLRVGTRLAWLCDIVLTLQQAGGFPGGCVRPRELEAYVSWWRRHRTQPLPVDDLGIPAEGNAVPPVAKRWNINYAASLGVFEDRAEQLYANRRQDRPAARP